MNLQLKNQMLLDPHFFSHPEATLLKLKPEYCLELPEVAINQDTPPWVLKTLLRGGTYHQRYAAARVCSDHATLEETFNPRLNAAYEENPKASLKVLLDSKAAVRPRHPLFEQWLVCCDQNQLVTSMIAYGYTPAEIGNLKALKPKSLISLKKQYFKKLIQGRVPITTPLRAEQVEEVYQSAMELEPAFEGEQGKIQKSLFLHFIVETLELGQNPHTPLWVLGDIAKRWPESPQGIKAQIRLLEVTEENLQKASKQSREYKVWAARHSRCPKLLNRMALMGIWEVLDNPHTELETKMIVLSQLKPQPPAENPNYASYWDGLNKEQVQTILEYMPTYDKHHVEILSRVRNPAFLESYMELVEDPGSLYLLAQNPHFPYPQEAKQRALAWYHSDESWARKPSILLDYLAAYGEEAAVELAMRPSTIDKVTNLRTLYPHLSQETQQQILNVTIN